MKEYPSISHDIDKTHKVYMVNKIDGSNIRSEYNKNRGFYKFGKRTTLIDETDKQFGKAVTLIKSIYAEPLMAKFKEMKISSAVAFFEFYGPSSFAGNHDPNENQTVTLLDVAADNKGIIKPSEFISNFGSLGIPDLLYKGVLTHEIITSIKESTFPGMAFEGVVCKSDHMESPGRPLMFKIKSYQWIDRLKEKCNGNQALFKQLY